MGEWRSESADTRRAARDFSKSFWADATAADGRITPSDPLTLIAPLRDHPSVGRLAIRHMRLLAEGIHRDPAGSGPHLNGDVTGLGYAFAMSRNRCYNGDLIALWHDALPSGSDVPGIVVPVLGVRVDLIVNGLDQAIGGTFDPSNADAVSDIVGDPRLAHPPAMMIEALGDKRDRTCDSCAAPVAYG